MSKLKMIVCLGVSASGKTTYAESLSQVEWLNINRDDIRINNYESENDDKFHWDKWDWSREDEVTAEQEKLVLLAHKQNMNTIISDTNLSIKARNKWEGMAKSLGFELEYKVFHITLEEALERDSKRKLSVGEDIIRKQYKTYQNGCKEFILEHFKNELEDKWQKNYYETNPVISDIDGTVACMKGVRTAFEWDKVDQDAPRPNVIKAVGHFSESKPLVFISGRDGCCYGKTLSWLDRFFHRYYPDSPFLLMMRKEGDYRKDWLIKLELLIKLADHYGKPSLVFDDRNVVVEVFRYVGLEVWQVQDGNF